MDDNDPEPDYVPTVFLTRDDHNEALREVHQRVDDITEEVRGHSQRIEHMDKTLGHIVSQQIDDGKRLREISQFNYMFLQEIQSVRAENLQWHQRWFDALNDVNLRLSKGNYYLVLLTCAVSLVCVIGTFAVFR